jgi:hypothetical protein
MARHRTEFEIDASDERVWAVLVDFEHYADWNPSVPFISGDVRVTHIEDLRGWIAPLFEKLMSRSVQQHHDAFNASLRNRAEAGTAR